MDEKLILHNRIKERRQKNLSQVDLAKIVGVSQKIRFHLLRQDIFCQQPSLHIALDRNENLFYF